MALSVDGIVSAIDKLHVAMAFGYSSVLFPTVPTNIT